MAGGPAWVPRIGLLAACGGLAVAAWAGRDLPVARVVAAAVVMRLVMLAVPPTVSDDAWRYLFDGLTQTHGHNPYLLAPADSPTATDWPGVLARMNSGSYYSVYPPLSQIAFFVGGVASRLTGSMWAGVYAINAVAFAAELAALLILARARARWLGLYAWNPLVLIEAAGQGHTEAFMLPLLVFAVLHHDTRPRLAGAMLGGAVMVKLYPALLLPVLWRRTGWRGVWPAGLVMAALALPYWRPGVIENAAESLRLYGSLFEFHAWPYLLLVAAAGRATATAVLGVALLVGILATYLLDRERVPVWKPFAALLGLVVVTATTVHPWYLLPLLTVVMCNEIVPEGAVAIRTSRCGLVALLVSALFLGTYLHYVPEGQAVAHALSVTAWAVGLATAVVIGARSLLARVLRLRGRGKAERVDRLLPPASRVLDLGCGEGHVGAALADLGHRVTLADVADFHRAALPFARYDGRRLPFTNDAFDAVVLYFVLHHAADPEAALAEAMRVGRRVVVVESVYRTARERRVLDLLDRLANRLRGGRVMAKQEEHLHFRPAAEWAELARRLGGEVVSFEEHGRPPHRQATAVIRAQQ